jgi:hypothetical protein
MPFRPRVYKNVDFNRAIRPFYFDPTTISIFKPTSVQSILLFHRRHCCTKSFCSSARIPPYLQCDTALGVSCAFLRIAAREQRRLPNLSRSCEPRLYGNMGEALIGDIKESFEASNSDLKWSFVDQSLTQGAGDAWSRSKVLDEKTGAVLQISSNATMALHDARAKGDASYNLLSAATLYFASARNQVIVLSITVPAVLALVNPILSKIAANSTMSFLQSASDGSVPSSALQCPQCLVSPLAIR